MTDEQDPRCLLLHKQPEIGDWIWVWRDDGALFDNPISVHLGEWDAIYWRDGDAKHSPSLTDLWAPCNKPVFEKVPTL